MNFIGQANHRKDPEFDLETTIEVWRTFIRQTEESIERRGLTNFTVKSDEILAFARKHWERNPKTRWNGRQIRNAFHTAIAMAEFDARDKAPPGEEPKRIVLRPRQFSKIASTVNDFDKYMIEMMGVTYEQQAGSEGLRHKKTYEEVKIKKAHKKGKKKAETSEEESDTSTSEDERGENGKNAVRAQSHSVDSDSDDSSSESSQ